MVHVPASRKGIAPWQREFVNQVKAEMRWGNPGAEAVFARLAEILFIQAVRAFVKNASESTASRWLLALQDPQISSALQLLHSEPAKAWTVRSLAGRNALSRSAFASKFSGLVGEPPLRYLTRIRLDLAAERLRVTSDKVSTIAASVGYRSVSSFERAFRRQFGISPGLHRRHSRR